MDGLAKGVGILAVLVALAAAIAFAAVGRGGAEYEATAKIAFIEDTQFDYVDAERDRLIGLVDLDEVLARPGVIDVEFDRPDTVTFFDITVTADTADTAADTADDVAEEIVAGDLELRRAPIEAERDVLSDQLDEIASRIAELEAAIAADVEREAFAEANRFEGDADQLERLTIELRQAQDSLFVNQRLRNSLDDYRIRAEERLAELDAELARTTAETRVVEPARIPTERADLSGTTAALLAGLAVLGLGGVGLAIGAAPARARTRP